MGEDDRPFERRTKTPVQTVLLKNDLSKVTSVRSREKSGEITSLSLLDSLFRDNVPDFSDVLWSR